MKKLIACCFVLIFCLPSFAASGDVKYLGGTIPVLHAGGTGTLDTSDMAVTFQYSGKKLTIPYDQIQSFEHSEQVARHLGVLPTIVVGLLRARQRRHYFRISYHDPDRVTQVGIFVVPKQNARALQAVLQARAGQICDACSHDSVSH